MTRRSITFLWKGALALVLAALVGSCARFTAATYDVGLKRYEPSAVAVLPTVLGSFTKARGVVERQTSVEIQAWGIKVVDPEMIKGVSSAELLRIVDDVQSQGAASQVLSKKLGEKLGADTFVVTEVTAWTYETSGKRKFAKVEIVLKLVEAATGRIVWQYTSDEEKEFWVIKPELKEISREVLAKIIKRMPKRRQ